MASKKTKIDPQYKRAADLTANDVPGGRDVAAEQETKGVELEFLSAEEKQQVLDQRAENDRQRLNEQAETALQQQRREEREKVLASKPLTPREHVRLQELENIANGIYPPKQPHPPAGMVPPQIMHELRVLRLRAKLTS